MRQSILQNLSQYISNLVENCPGTPPFFTQLLRGVPSCLLLVSAGKLRGDQ